ncbi:TetR/AcrR family transcriptional regulator C-terminal ligand-binding domain-containing protein [Streptomyces canus]
MALTDLAAALADQADVPGFVSLLAAAQKDPAVGEALRNGALDPMRRNCRNVIQRAIGRGELQDAALSDVLFDLVLGQVLARTVVQGKAFPPDVREQFVDTVLLHVLAQHP